MIKTIKKHHYILIFILLVGLFFRTYQLVDRYAFAHDADLYSWIVKDIVVNHHFRLIGQLTSADGIFIGPIFYYSLIPFFILTKMDPIGALIPITILGILTLISYYFVFTKIFNKQVGLIAIFLQSVLLTQVNSDRWVVPTAPTSIWVVWYFYCLLQITRGKYQVLPILGLLVGLIWNIHIALVPTLLAIPIAILVSKKMPSTKQVAMFFLVLIISSLPLIAFEAKHNFSQTNSLLNNFKVNHGGKTGLEKLNLNILKITQNTGQLFFYPQTFPIDARVLVFVILLSPIILIRKKLIKFIEVLPLYFWIIGVLVFFTLSSSPVSEYYFASLDIIFFSFVVLLGYLILKTNRTWKFLVLILLTFIGIKNLYFFTNEYYYHKGYVEKKAAAKFVADDSKQKGYPCVAISYITPPGENVGFRYFFWLDKLHVNQSWSGSPDYTIVIPDELSSGSINARFGHVGVIVPHDNIPNKESIDKSCSGQDSNLTDPLFGYTE